MVYGTLLRYPIALAVVCAVAFGAPALASESGCQLKQYASLQLGYSARGVPVLSVLVGDQRWPMMLNLASAFSAISQPSLQALGLKAQSFPMGTPEINMGRQRVQSYVPVPVLQFGSLRLTNYQLLLSPNSAEYIGADLFRNLDVELDFAHNKINLFAQEHCSRSPVYWADSYAVAPLHRGSLNDLYFDVELDGKKLQAVLATGTESSRLDAIVTKPLYGWDIDSPGVETISKSGAVERYRAMSLTANGLSVMNANIDLFPPSDCERGSGLTTDADNATGFRSCYGIYPLQLGMNVLKKLRLYVATKEQKLYITAADAHN